ncbi:(4Fe-4S)-binding protein [Taibaiella sp. KBW10]|uniref:(4Fe-4S)-binding protein n=1 Tax=Taibaiella sp. KBW10 TaxID=2153357 RepID=UPI000F5A46FB|nr:(4Fe-4S)-binding protein [Taibaiella sp. KBW10]RQO30633.1 (4Fe-4S)-binding protein [Taibaiella sp. KBW10]
METKEYSNGEITVLWQAEKCIHSGICVKTLPKVYTPKEKPWVHPHEADAAALKDQIEHCPSGALTYRMDKPADNEH